MTSVDRGAAAAALALQHAGVGDLAAAGGVEGRLDQLDEDVAVVCDRGADRRLGVGRLIADELGLEARRSPDSAARLLAQRRHRRARRASPRAPGCAGPP